MEDHTFAAIIGMIGIALLFTGEPIIGGIFLGISCVIFID